jgi:aspartyl protease family protein
MVWILAVLLCVAGLVLGLGVLFPGALAAQGAQMNLAYGLALVAILFASLALTPRLRAKETVKAAFTWLAVFLALLTFYRYQDGFRQLGREMIFAIDPAEPKSQGGTEQIRASVGGHFVVTAEVEGKRVRFLVDTGATSVVLTRDDARRIGIKVDDLDYITPVATANGMTTVAPVRLNKIRIGSIEVKNVSAAVAHDGLEGSLLGMTYLHRLKSFKFSGQELVLEE